MELRQIRAFVAIAEAGTFTAGAARVHITQAAISMQIRQLEIETGAQLFVRAPRRVILTEAGEKLLERARHILLEHDAALEEIASRTPVYAGKKACDECHSDVLEKLAKAEHKTLSCEACHGVSQEHAANPDITPIKLTGNHCIRCHEGNPSRPAWFKQITVKNHYTGQKCSECHVPHQPNEVP